MDCRCIWIVRLTVGNNHLSVDGWAFMEPEYTELRFETWPAMEPPRFLLGIEPALSWEENSLAAVAVTSDVPLHAIEQHVRDYLASCLFCIRTVTDSCDSNDHHQAICYHQNGNIIPIMQKNKRLLIGKDVNQI